MGRVCVCLYVTSLKHASGEKGLALLRAGCGLRRGCRGGGRLV